MDARAGKIRAILELGGERIINAAVDGERGSALPCNDAADLPAIHRFVRKAAHAKVRKLVRARELKYVSDIVVRWTVVEVAVKGIRGSVVGTYRGEVVHVFRPRIVCQQGQPRAHAFFDGELQTVVVRVDGGIDHADVAVALVQAP